jgi:hypothetical protein
MESLGIVVVAFALRGNPLLAAENLFADGEIARLLCRRCRSDNRKRLRLAHGSGGLSD